MRPRGSFVRVGITRPTDPLNSGPATSSGLVRLRLRLRFRPQAPEQGWGSWARAKGAVARAKQGPHGNLGDAWILSWIPLGYSGLGSLQLRILGWVESSVYGYGYLAWPGIRILHKYADAQPPIAPTPPLQARVPAQHVSPAPSKATIRKAIVVIVR